MFAYVEAPVLDAQERGPLDRSPSRREPLA
jgi:hypothetical protein